MSRRAWRTYCVVVSATGRLTVAQIALAAVLAVGSLALVVIRPSASLLAAWAVPTLIASCSLVLALIVARKAPTNRCAPLMALTGLVLVVLTVTDVYFTAAATDPTLPVSPYLIALTEGSWMLYYVTLALLMLFFPTGRLLEPAVALGGGRAGRRAGGLRGGGRPGPGRPTPDCSPTGRGSSLAPWPATSSRSPCCRCS